MSAQTHTDDQALRPASPSDPLADALIKNLQPFELKDQIEGIKRSNIVEPTRSVAILLLKAQWLEYRLKGLLQIFTDLTYRQHQFLKNRKASKIATRKITLGPLIDKLLSYEICSKSIDTEFRSFLNKTKTFSDKRNQYVHHYFSDPRDKDAILSEVATLISTVDSLNTEADKTIGLWLEVLYQDLKGKPLSIM